jgi:hypothetical protein
VDKGKEEQSRAGYILWFGGCERGYVRHDLGIGKAAETPVVGIMSRKKGPFHGSGMAEIITRRAKKQQGGCNNDKWILDLEDRHLTATLRSELKREKPNTKRLGQ